MQITEPGDAMLHGTMGSLCVCRKTVNHLLLRQPPTYEKEGLRQAPFELLRLYPTRWSRKPPDTATRIYPCPAGKSTPGLPMTLSDSIPRRKGCARRDERGHADGHAHELAGLLCRVDHLPVIRETMEHQIRDLLRRRHLGLAAVGHGEGEHSISGSVIAHLIAAVGRRGTCPMLWCSCTWACSSSAPSPRPFLDAA